MYELGSGCLTDEEQDRIRQALRAEVSRLRHLAVNIDFSRQGPVNEPQFRSSAQSVNGARARSRS